MKKYIVVLFVIAFACVFLFKPRKQAFAPPVNPIVEVTEIDGAPSTFPYQIKFTNTTVTDNGDGTVTVATGAGGGGDFSGPASATDNAVVRFDGTGGKTGQDSNLIIQDLTDIFAQEFMRYNGGDMTTAADGDQYNIDFNLENSANTQKVVIRKVYQINDVTDTTEDGQYILQMISNGALNQIYRARSSAAGVRDFSINPTAVDINTIIQSDNDTSLFHADGGTDSIGIGGSGDLGKFYVDGKADEVQCLIQSHSTNTNNVFVVENSSATDLVTIDNNGLIQTAVGLDGISAVDMDYGSADVTDHTFTTDGTGTAEIVLPAGSIDSTEILDDTIVNADINSSAAISISKTALVAGTNITLSTDTLNVDDSFLLNTGDVGTGVYDFGGATSFELPQSATPTTDSVGEISLDTTITDHQPLWQYEASGTQDMTIIAIDTAELPATDNEIIKYDAATDKFVLEADGGSGGGTGYQDLYVQSAKLTGSFVTNSAAIDGGDGNWRLLFDDSSTESAVWQFRMPPTYGSALDCRIGYSMTSATTNKVDFEVDVMAVSDGDAADIGTASFATTNEIAGGTTVPGTAGYLDEIDVTLTNADSVAAGDLVYIRINRDHDDADDTASGDAEVVYIQLTWTEA